MEDVEEEINSPPDAAAAGSSGSARLFCACVLYFPRGVGKGHGARLLAEGARQTAECS